MSSSSAPVVTAEERYAAVHGVQMRDALIFLVDWRHGMATGRMHDDDLERGAPPLAVALETITNLMIERIKDDEKDLFGIVAFGAGAPGEVMPGSSQRWEGVRVVVALSELDAENIIRLQEITRRLKRGDARKMRPMEPDFRSRRDGNFCFGEDAPLDFKHALWAVRSQFQRRRVDASGGKLQFNLQRCHVFTDDDDPVGGFADGGAGERSGAVSNAADLSEAGVTVEVSFLRVKERVHDFDAAKFYKSIVYVDRDEFEDSGGGVRILAEGFESAAELRVEISRKTRRKRVIARMELRLDKGLAMGVSLYATVRKTGPPREGKLQKSTGKKVVKSSQTLCSWTGKPLGSEDVRVNFDKNTFLRSDIRSAAEMAEKVGNAGEVAPDFDADTSEKEEVSDESSDEEGNGGAEDGREKFVLPPVAGFTADELKNIGKLGEQDGLTLFGFRSVEKLRTELILKPAYFVYPDEHFVKGSTKAFAALHTSMFRAKRMAIVLRGSRYASSGGPRFGALVAQEEIFDAETGLQIKPPGMLLVTLPYKNDIYTSWENELNDLAKEEEEWEDKAKALDTGGSSERKDGDVSDVTAFILKKVKREEFSPEHYRNPLIDRYFAVMEVTVEIKSRLDPLDDSLEPDVEAIRRRTTRHKGTENETDYLREFQKLTMGEDVNAADLAELYGTKTARKSKEVAMNKLKRKAVRDAKADAARMEIDVDMFKKAAKDDKLEKFLVKDLQLYCTAYGLPTSGKKDFIIQRIQDHITGDDEVV